MHPNQNNIKDKGQKEFSQYLHATTVLSLRNQNKKKEKKTSIIELEPTK